MYRRAWIVGAFVAAALVSSSSPASADEFPRLHVDWEKLAELMRADSLSFLPTMEITPGPSAATHGTPQEPQTESKWIGLSPHWSIIARDWRSSQLLVGQASIIDLVRLSRSTRMAVTRLRLSDTRFAPFAQIGLGQWRIDRDVLQLPNDVELASQFGTGFELRLAARCVLATELDYTVLMREEREAGNLVDPHIWGASLAARAAF
jgi:hypothetical protein